MPLTQKIFAITASTLVFLAILELVRRRRLKEEYALLWIVTGAAMLVLTLYYPLLELLTQLIGAVLPTTTLFLFAVLFLLMIAVHLTVVISRLTSQVHRLAQEIALMTAEQDLARRRAGPAPVGGPDP